MKNKMIQIRNKIFKNTNIISQIIMLPRFIITFLHENGHAKEFIKANKRLGKSEKIIVIIGCRALLTDDCYKYHVCYNSPKKIYIFINNWWYCPDDKSSIGFAECSDHTKYKDEEIIKMAKAGDKATNLYCVILFIISIFAFYMSYKYPNLLSIIIYFIVIYHFLFSLWEIVKKIGNKDNNENKEDGDNDNTYSKKPFKFKEKESKYDEILDTLKKNK